MILVAGGTGSLGTRVVRLLCERGDAVRVLTRDVRRADHVRDLGAEAITGDVRDPATVAAAVHGCSTVVSAIHGFAGGRRSGPAAIDRDANRTIVRACVEQHVNHMVLVSVYGAAPHHPMSLHRMKYVAEQDLIGSGLRWTVIRPSAFFETWVDLIGARLADQGKALVFGPGDNAINFVSVDEVAAMVDEAVHDAALWDRAIDVTGPENLTFNDIATRLIAVSTKPGRITRIPLPVLRAMSVVAKPVAPAFARKTRAAVVMNTTRMAVGGPHTGPHSTAPAERA